MAIAADYVEQRYAHGVKLADRESVQWQLGDAAMQIEIGRMLRELSRQTLDAVLPENRVDRVEVTRRDDV